MNWWSAFNSVAPCGEGDSLPRSRPLGTSVVFKQTSSPKSWPASVMQEVMHCKDISVLAAKSRSSAKQRSQISFSRVFVLSQIKQAVMIWCKLFLSSKSFVACFSITLKIVKRVGAMTQTCFTLLVIRKSSERSLLHLIWSRLAFVLLDGHIQEIWGTSESFHYLSH